MRADRWAALRRVEWKKEAPREYLTQEAYTKLLDELFRRGHMAESFNEREEWSVPDVFSIERRGYWDHIYLGGTEGVRHFICHSLDDSQNVAAAKQGFISDMGRRANSIEQRMFKEINGVTERQAFGYSDPDINRCVPKQLYYVNTRWSNKKIKSAGKADFSSHYPANICGPLPNWSKRKICAGTMTPTKDYPFVFYTRSGHFAEYNKLDTHEWLDEDLCMELFGANYVPTEPDDDISVMCPAANYTLDSIIEMLYDLKSRDESVDGIKAKDILVSSIGYKHLRGPLNTHNRLYHLAAVCIARANQRMIDLYNRYSKTVLQIIVDCIIYMGPTEIGISDKRLGELHQEVTDNSFIMLGANQYMFIDSTTGECTACAHSGFDTDIATSKLEDIRLWRRTRISDIK